jgi:ABC transport system ATP-binding/permease protein
MNARSRTATARIDFSATDRQTKQLVVLSGVTYGIGDRNLFENVDFAITSGMRVGLVGPNGSGKTTLLRLLKGDIAPAKGEIRKADSLRIVSFDQNRELDPDVTLRRALAPDSDAVIYQDQVIHVASWAARFLFDGEDLNQRVGRLSGGERARVLIARLMLQPADVLLLDEPTNDLDIPTLEILEESLLEYRGALVLVTHDRYMLDRVSTVVLGLNGLGGAERFANYEQWEDWKGSRQGRGEPNLTAAAQPSPGAPAETKAASAKKKLSYSEADRELHARQAAIEDPAIIGDHAAFREACAQLETAQSALDGLYARWAALEQKKG